MGDELIHHLAHVSRDQVSYVLSNPFKLFGFQSFSGQHLEDGGSVVDAVTAAAFPIDELAGLLAEADRLFVVGAALTSVRVGECLLVDPIYLVHFPLDHLVGVIPEFRETLGNLVGVRLECLGDDVVQCFHCVGVCLSHVYILPEGGGSVNYTVYHTVI